MKKFIYPACFYKEPDGQYSVIFPDLGGATCGKDLEQAYNMAVDYLGGTIMSMQDDGEAIPAASDITAIVADEYENGFVSLISVDPEEYRKSVKSVKKTLTIPDWLNKLAEEQKVNFSQLLQEALKQYLNL